MRRGEGSQPEHMQLAVRQGDVLSLLKANGLSAMRDALALLPKHIARAPLAGKDRKVTL